MARFPSFLSVTSLALSFCSIVNAMKEVNVPAAQLNFGSGVWNFADTGRYCAQDHYWTRNTGATVSYRFNGSAVAVHAFKFSDGATVSIDVDGSKTTIDTYVTTYDCFSVIFNSGALPYGQHTITIRTLDADTFYIRGITYATYDENELASVAVASMSSAQLASQSIASTASMASVSASGYPGGKSSNTGAIAGGVVGGLLGLGIIIALIIFLMRRNNNKGANTGAGAGMATSPQAESGWKPNAQPGWNGQPLPYQGTGQTGTPASPNGPYNSFLPNQPTGTTSAGVGYLGAQPTGTSTQERPMSAFSQQGYSMGAGSFQQPPVSPAPSGAYQGHPIPMEYGNPSVTGSPAPGGLSYTTSPSMTSGGIPPEQHQQPNMYGGNNGPIDPSRMMSPAPAYDNGMYAPQGMYPRQQ